jgi:ectoine hydroxylase-related dioxygenase (phytanoyl-CoA dioxygenase family)
MVTAAQKKFYDENGYVIIEQLFSDEEVAFYREHYMRLREAGTYEGDNSGIDLGNADPLKRYPRMIHMHRWDDVSLRWMLDQRLNDCLTALAGREPFAVQTMLYFKPPKARGQALHQDNYYLRAQPGTCVAAWLALDDCDEENGCLEVASGSHTWPILCTVKADVNESFTDVTVPIPEGQEVRPMIMKAGSVLFFNGSLVHGSKPNISTTRFRRALIGHYIEGDAKEVYRWYHPVLRMDGSEVTMEQSEVGSQCGVWVDQEQDFELVPSAPFPERSE